MDQTLHENHEYWYLTKFKPSTVHIISPLPHHLSICTIHLLKYFSIVSWCCSCSYKYVFTGTTNRSGNNGTGPQWFQHPNSNSLCWQHRGREIYTAGLWYWDTVTTRRLDFLYDVYMIMPPFEKGGAYCFAHVGRYVGRSVGRYVGSP